jgi:hypothetical protein
MTKFVLICTALTLGAAVVSAQKPSPPAETSVTIGGKAITIKYSAPSLRGRQMFGEGGRISKDPNYPVWRAGANSATALHTEANLDINGLKVPAGDYTLFALVNTDPWQLIVSKETGEWGLAYKPANDLGRVKMTMSKPSAPIETYKMTLTSTGPKSGKLQLEWENVIASVPFTVQ